jgi:hypothetical protein
VAASGGGVLPLKLTGYAFVPGQIARKTAFLSIQRLIGFVS